VGELKARARPRYADADPDRINPRL